MTKKEIYWITGTIVFVLIFIIGIRGFNFDSDIDINIYDALLVIPKIYFVLLFGSLIFFGVYLIRMLNGNFKNLTVNLIFIISNIGMLLISTFAYSLVNSMSIIEATKASSNQLNSGIHGAKGNVYFNLANVVIIIQLFLFLFLTYSAFRTGQNYKRN